MRNNATGNNQLDTSSCVQCVSMTAFASSLIIITQGYTSASLLVRGH
jgi:hypothetical protein